MKIVYTICFVLLGCKSYHLNTIALQYDLYKNDTLEKKNALKIEYKKMDTGAIRIVNIISNSDSMDIQFREKTTGVGIYRSIDSSEFNLTHSFLMGKEVKSLLPKSYPIFLNTWTKAITEKKYPFSNKDSINIIFFDETIPFYTFTSSYYSRRFGFFLVYYNQRNNSYFKLSKVLGLSNNVKNILRVTDELSHDTLFFGKHYKLPSVEPPALKE